MSVSQSVTLEHLPIKVIMNMSGKLSFMCKIERVWVKMAHLRND
jgi:hypothetical protein